MNFIKFSQNCSWSASKRILILSLFSLVILFFDQWTKAWARGWGLQFQTHEYLGGLLKLVLAENTGAFLSLGAEFSPKVRQIVFIVLVAIFLAWALWYLIKNTKLNYIQFWGWAFLFVGGAGNLIDRIYKGSVTDFLLIDFGVISTGIFNVADMAIVVGFILLLLLDIKIGNQKKVNSLAEP